HDRSWPWWPDSTSEPRYKWGDYPIAFAAYRGLYAGLSETLGVSDGDVLATPVAMVYQAVHAARLSSVQRLLQGSQNEVCSHAVAHPPANDTPGKYIDHEGDVEPALPR